MSSVCTYIAAIITVNNRVHSQIFMERLVLEVKHVPEIRSPVQILINATDRSRSILGLIDLDSDDRQASD